MGGRNHLNVLLVEILIALFFFMISATVVVQVFATSHSLGARADVETEALTAAQNVAEALYAADAPDEALQTMGFRLSHGIWTCGYGDYTLCVEAETRQEDAGTLWQATVRALCSPRGNSARAEADELFALPCARYREGPL